MTSRNIPSYASLRVGWAMGEWLHEYLIEDVVAELARCVEGIQRDILPTARAKSPTRTGTRRRVSGGPDK